MILKKTEYIGVVGEINSNLLKLESIEKVKIKNLIKIGYFTYAGKTVKKDLVCINAI